MSDNNPYSTPASTVDSPTSPNALPLHPPRAVGIGNGLSWIGQGFGHFKQDPGPWILICIVGFVIMMVLAFIPLVNFLYGIVAYVWVGGLMLGCKAQDDGESITIGHLFAGFQNKFGSLLLVGVIVFIASVAIMAVAMGPVFMQMMSASVSGDPTQMEAIFEGDPMQTFVLPMLIGLLFFIPLIMMAWFAPMLIVLNDVPVFKAMGMSFMGCLKNILPFLLYGIVMLVLYILAVIPLLLGLLIFMPTAFASMYRSYKDIYIET